MKSAAEFSVSLFVRNKKNVIILILLLQVSPLTPSSIVRYPATWEALDRRPLPKWYDAAKIGVFVHWGVYSVTSFKNEWFWLHWNKNDSDVLQFLSANGYSNKSYEDFATNFTAEKFNPDAWASLFKKSGAKYVVITTKHHDGFTLFPTNRSTWNQRPWNSVDIGPKIDIVEALSKSIRKVGLKFGIYYSLFEWFHPLIQRDFEYAFYTHLYTDTVIIPDIRYLINKYKPSILWSDGDGVEMLASVMDDRYFKSKKILAWLFNKSPVRDEVVVNDRWGGLWTHCMHGDVHVCEDRYNPRTLQMHKWENAFPLDNQSWGYRRDMEPKDVLTFYDLLEQLVSTVSCGGNVLINVGLTKEGIIPQIFQERLLNLGLWLETNGEAIYNTSPWYHQRDGLNKDTWYTCLTRDYNSSYPTYTPYNASEVLAVYAIFLKWPEDNRLVIHDIGSYLETLNESYRFEMLSSGSRVSVEHKRVRSDNDTNIEVYLPTKTDSTREYGWTLKITPSETAADRSSS